MHSDGEDTRQVYPLCPMCSTPTRVWDFLRAYQGYKLDIIKVCFQACTQRFDALPEIEQFALLHRAMVKAYGETAVIYALQYDDHFPLDGMLPSCVLVGNASIMKQVCPY